MKPNYMVIGASKCATSTICNLLGQHPDIFMVKCKEPQFFSKDEVYSRGLDWYESLYEESGDRKMRGEGSNTYTQKEVFPNTASRIVAYNPNLKLIYVVRNPIARIESFWMEIRGQGGEAVHYDFNTAVRVNRDWLVDASNYWQQINEYRPYFSDEQIHIIFSEDLKADSTAVMHRCFEFLGVEPDMPFMDLNLHINRTTNRAVPKKTLSQLREYSIFRNAVKLVPESFRISIKRQLFFQKIKSKPQWNPETREWVADLLEADTHKFLEYCGKTKDFWNLRDSGLPSQEDTKQLNLLQKG
ncbi:MAG: sulfotransferase [Calothrix sp. MO_192.B10]|nr:sulfotransferase [Calothrix sp. MO_192.B10]